MKPTKKFEIERETLPMKEKINYLKGKKKEIILLIALLLFLLLTYTVFTNKITSLDEWTHAQVLKIRDPQKTRLLLMITNISGTYTLIALSIALFFLIKNKKAPLYISLNLIFVFLTSQIAKIIFLRPRPSGINLIEETGYSYPSGHSMVSMAYFGFIAYLIYKANLKKPLKWASITLIFLTVLSIGFSRVYLGVHYLSDVVGGYLLAIAYLMLYICIINKERK